MNHISDQLNSLDVSEMSYEDFYKKLTINYNPVLLKEKLDQYQKNARARGANQDQLSAALFSYMSDLHSAYDYNSLNDRLKIKYPTATLAMKNLILIEVSKMSSKEKERFGYFFATATSISNVKEEVDIINTRDVNLQQWKTILRSLDTTLKSEVKEFSIENVTVIIGLVKSKVNYLIAHKDLIVDTTQSQELIKQNQETVIQLDYLKSLLSVGSTDKNLQKEQAKVDRKGKEVKKMTKVDAILKCIRSHWMSLYDDPEEMDKKMEQLFKSYIEDDEDVELHQLLEFVKLSGDLYNEQQREGRIMNYVTGKILQDIKMKLRIEKKLQYDEDEDDDIVIEDESEPDKHSRFSKQNYNAIVREFTTTTKNSFPHSYESARDMYHAYRYMGKYDKLITLINCKKMTFSPTSRNIATRYRSIYRAIEEKNTGYQPYQGYHFFVKEEDKILCNQFMSNTVGLLMQKNVESKKKRKEFQGKVEMEKYSKRVKGVLYIE